MPSRILALFAAALLCGCPSNTTPDDATADGSSSDVSTSSDVVRDTSVRDVPAIDSTVVDAGDASVTPVACVMALMGPGGGRCATPNEMCATSTRCGVDVRQCTCTGGAWICSTLPPTPCSDGGGPDASVLDAGPRPDGGGTFCEIVGTYRTSIMGMTLYFRFNADGTWQAGTTLSMLGGGPSGTYTWVGGELTILDSSCGAAAGLYRLSFSPSCEMALLGVVSDSCTGRAMTLNGLLWQRDHSSTSDGGGAPDVVTPGDSGPASDVPTARDASTPGDGGLCSIVGTYTLSLGGMSVYFRFNSAGEWAIASSEAELDTAPLTTGTYTFSDTGVLVLAGDPGCAAGDMGRFSIGFNATCSTATMTLLSDDCTGRGTTLDGSVLARVR